MNNDPDQQKSSPDAVSNASGQDTSLAANETGHAAPVDAPSLKERLAARGFTSPYKYDVDLFRELNRIYADDPLVPAPRKRVSSALLAQGNKRADELLTFLPSFKGLNVLELGCGRGETALYLAKNGNCKVTGVDIVKYGQWENRENASVRFVQQDITHKSSFKDNSFDFIYSFATLEHVKEPMAMLTSMAKLLKPGGTLFFTVNLYRGPSASHRYAEVFFPWPHLLFDDQVFRQYYKEENSDKNGVPAWVNKATHLHYLDRARKLKLKVVKASYTRRRPDNEFIKCFDEKLGKYPKEDLDLDFLKARFIKPIEDKDKPATVPDKA